jgi:Haem-degrading
MITLNNAREIISAAEKRALEIGQPMNIAVVDSGANLIAHARMDGAWIGSIDISINKAFTARALDISTKELATHSSTRQTVLWNSRFKPRPNHDFCRRYSPETRRQGNWRHRGERGFRRAGSNCRGRRRSGFQTELNYSTNSFT